MASASYTVEPVRVEGRITDVRILRDDRTQHLGGRRGGEAELGRAARIEGTSVLPVFLGAGLGVGLADVLERTGGPVAVVDAETAILDLTGVRGTWQDDPRVCWLDSEDADTA